MPKLCIYHYTIERRRSNHIIARKQTHQHTAKINTQEEAKERAGGGDELKLLSTWFSPFGSRVMLALHLKGLSYEYMEEEDVINNKSQLLLESNPVHKKVPVLFHKGKVLCESMIIVNYLEEAFPDAGPSLLPSDPYERAIARFWAAFIETKVTGLINVLPSC
jgi:hypothetical protein